MSSRGLAGEEITSLDCCITITIVAFFIRGLPFLFAHIKNWLDSELLQNSQELDKHVSHQQEETNGFCCLFAAILSVGMI